MKTPIQMKLITTVMVIATISALPAYGEETTRPVDIEKVQLGAQAQLINKEGQALLRVEGATGKKPQDIHLFDLDQPAITQDAYALTGEIRYENVAGRSYLETWNHFASREGDQSVPTKFFTRAVNHTGPMAVINANSDWRPFQLPFFINAGDSKLATKPTKITFNLHLEGAGLVEIRNVKLLDGLQGGGFSRPRPIPKPMEILVFLAIVIAVTTAVTVIAVASVRRKKRTINELRRIQASDV